MADVFSTEDYEDCTDKNNETEASSSEIEVEVEDITDSQNLLNSDSDSLNEPVKDCSDMTLKQGVSEPELFAAEDILVNPDDLLPPVVKLEKYANSDIVFNRQVVVRNLLETLRIVHENKDDVASVINVITGISEDYDPSVRTELMMHLPHLAAFCKEVKLNYITIQYLVPMLISYLGDDNNLIRKAAQSALLSLIEQGLLEKDLVVEKICPLVLHLTDSIHQEDLRIESIVLMSKLVTQMGKKVTEELFFDPLFNLLQETSNYIRKACASTFGDVCTAVGREITEEVLLPKFFALCEDDAWCVRKACAENFMTVSCCVSKDTRRKELCSLYMILLSDTSRWVRMTAYQALGAFISTFAEPDRTGLYYSKDGTLTVVEDAPSPEVLTAAHEHGDDPTNETICNGELQETNNLSSDDCSSSLDRTNSSKPCDSVVPVCNTNTNNSASDVPGNTCHVGKYCTVILNSSTMTSSERDQSQENMLCNDSSTGSSHCDSKQLTENLQSGDNFASAHGEVVQNGELLNPSEEGTSAGSTEDKLNQSLTEFKKLWIEAVYSCNELVNGASTSDEINGGDGMCVDLDSDVVQYMKPDEKSALLNSIIVNGVNINSSVALSGTVNCGAIPFISCSNSIRENGTSSSPEKSEDSEVLSSDIKHSTHNIMCTEDSCVSSDGIPNLTFNTQELNNASEDISLDVDSEELKVNSESTDNESAFNHFQYWREPLPEIDIDTATDCLNESPKQSGVYFMCESEDHFDGQQERGNWFSYLKECSNKRTFITYSGLDANSSLLMQLNAVNDDEASGLKIFKKCCKWEKENKGEPPPGPKLTPHDQDIVPPELLFQYLSMIDPSSTSSTDAEMARHCAYSLPAVALTLGRKNWPCLKETFNALTSDLQGFIMMWKVRRTIASGMHQLAVILGPDITSQDLLPVFFRFITDLDEVRIGILQNLCEFLKVLRSEERKQFLPSLPEFLVCFGDSDTNLKNWRFRLILAEQLVLISNLYEPQEVRDHLVPLSLTLIKDKICEVRLAAVRVVAAVMKRLSQNPTPVYTKAMLSELTEKFVHSPKWLHRQLYVYVCQQIILEKALSPDQFAEDALPQLLYLCWDRVPNVRIAIARCLVVGIWPMDVYSNPESPHRELLLQTIHTLQSDMDADVRFYANMVSTHECSCLQNGEFTNAVEPFV